MEHQRAKPRVRRRRTGPWWLLAAGLAILALVLAVGPAVVPLGRAASARTSIPAGSAEASGAELTRALRTGSARTVIAGAAGVPSRRLDPGLEARRGPAGSVVVQYRAERSARELRRVTAAAARYLADAVAVSDLAEADQRVAETETRVERAADAIDAHETATGIVDPTGALTTSEQRLAALQLQRDQAVAAGNVIAPSLEQQVAAAQQEKFDLELVTTRRVELVDAQERAVVAAEDAEAARRIASDRVDSSVGTEPTVTVDEGTTSLPTWWAVAVGVVVFLALSAGAIGVIRVHRTRNRRRETRRTTPTRATDPVIASDAPSTRIELDEIERRLAALDRRTLSPGDADDDPRIDQRT